MYVMENKSMVCLVNPFFFDMAVGMLNEMVEMIANDY